MTKKMTLLLVGFSFVAAGVADCASLFGPDAPELPNVLGTPLSVDLTKTPALPGKIGDPVAPSGRTTLPGELTIAASIGVDLSNTSAPRGVIGDPVAPSGKTTLPGESTLSYPMK